ncbi:MAG: hypothetical protein ACI4P3_03120, partial [Candidatus Spyradosoma sp.]
LFSHGAMKARPPRGFKRQAMSTSSDARRESRAPHAATTEIRFSPRDPRRDRPKSPLERKPDRASSAANHQSPSRSRAFSLYASGIWRDNCGRCQPHTSTQPRNRFFHESFNDFS